MKFIVSKQDMDQARTQHRGPKRPYKRPVLKAYRRDLKMKLAEVVAGLSDDDSAYPKDPGLYKNWIIT